MSSGKVAYMKFVLRLFEIFENVFFQNTNILTIVSYFWDALDLNHKIEWKEYAKCENLMKNLTGKKKFSGFWFFGKSLFNSLLTGNIKFFEDIWDCMAQEEKSLWEILGEEEVNEWVDRQICIALGNLL